MNKSKIDYLLRSVGNVFQQPKCPSCGSTLCKEVDRKYLVTSLKECQNCFLQYRHPVDAPSFNEEFYQEEYVEKGLTTDLPSEEELQRLLKTSFNGTEKDFSFHINLIRSFFDKKDIKVLDFGANWGYCSLQFKEAGFITDSYEISKHKANFGKKLGVEIKTELDEIGSGYDVFFSSHVIEHHPKVSDMIALARKVLKEGGLFITFCPNGSQAFRDNIPEEFHVLWGMVHPNYLNDKFYQKTFENNPYLITSSGYYDQIASEWDEQKQQVSNVSGPEILVIAANKNLQLAVKVAVAQMGARMHYAVPRVLNDDQKLEVLYTDIAANKFPLQLLQMIPGGLMPEFWV